MSEQNRFGYEWSTYDEIVPLYEEQFRRWVSPLKESDFKEICVLDAGCGTGRNSLWPLKYGAKHVTAFDVDPRTVAVAKKHLASHANATVQVSSIYDIPFENDFDLTFSIGVIHHLENPRKAVANLVRATKPGGKTLIWVYGKEGHTLLKHLVNGLRRVTCRIPVKLLNLLVYPVSLVCYLYVKLLPHRHPYMRLFKTARFWHLHSIIFDQLLPEISNYWTRDEALALFDGLPVQQVESHFCNKGSWTIIAIKENISLEGS